MRAASYHRRPSIGVVRGGRVEEARDGACAARESDVHGVVLAGGAVGEERRVLGVVEHVVVPAAAELAVVIDPLGLRPAHEEEARRQAVRPCVLAGEEVEEREAADVVSRGCGGEGARGRQVGTKRRGDGLCGCVRHRGEGLMSLGVRLRPIEVLLVDVDRRRGDYSAVADEDVVAALGVP